MENSKQIEVNTPVLFKKQPVRHRQRRGYTLAPETISELDKMVESGEAPNVSRAIDFLMHFYQQNHSSVHLKFEPKARGVLTRHFMSKGFMLSDGLAAMALSVIEKNSPE